MYIGTTKICCWLVLSVKLYRNIFLKKRPHCTFMQNANMEYCLPNTYNSSKLIGGVVNIPFKNTSYTLDLPNCVRACRRPRRLKGTYIPSISGHSSLKQYLILNHFPGQVLTFLVAQLL